MKELTNNVGKRVRVTNEVYEKVLAAREEGIWSMIVGGQIFLLAYAFS